MSLSENAQGSPVVLTVKLAGLSLSRGIDRCRVDLLVAVQSSACDLALSIVVRRRLVSYSHEIGV